MIYYIYIYIYVDEKTFITGNNKKQKIKGSWQEVNRGWYTPTPSDASNTATTTRPSPGVATLSTPPQEGEGGDTRQVVLVAKRIVAKEKLVCAAVRMGWARKIPAQRCSTEVLARRAAWVKQYYNASLLKSLRANEYLAARQMKMEFKNQFDMQLYPSALKAAFGKLSAARRDAAAAAAAAKKTATGPAAAAIAAVERVTAAATGPAAAAAAAAGARTITQADVVVDELEEIVAFANGPPGQVNAMLGDDLEDIQRMREAGIIVITEVEQLQ
jgi:hypothetical protein